MNAQSQLAGGFADPVHDAQTAFRRVLDALSRPGRPVTLGRPVKSLPVGAAMSHLLLALTDDDTAVWWQHREEMAAQWLRFHTGARVASAPDQAAFAVLTDAGAMAALETFAQGSMASPEESTTLLVEVPSLDDGPAVEWRGPGIKAVQTVRIAGLPDNFWTQWHANHARFPQGVDMVFCCADRALGLPRTTRVRRLEGV